jgi:hypothetical protein
MRQVKSVVANHPSGFFTLAAAPRQPLDAMPTSPRKTRVRGFCRHASGQTSSRRRCRSIITPGSRGCGYKTVSGRHEFVNRDPLAENGGLNLYAYCRNNPVSLIDLLGLCPPDPDLPWWLQPLPTDEDESLADEVLDLTDALGITDESGDTYNSILQQQIQSQMQQLYPNFSNVNPMVNSLDAGAVSDLSVDAFILGTAAYSALADSALELSAAEGNTVALDANAFRNLGSLQSSGVVGSGDTLIVTPNVQGELARQGVTMADLNSAGVQAISSSPIGASVPASSLAQTLRGLGGPGAASASADALNISEAAGAGANVFVTQDSQILRAFGGGVTLPNSGGTFINVLGF